MELHIAFDNEFPATVLSDRIEYFGSVVIGVKNKGQHQSGRQYDEDESCDQIEWDFDKCFDNDSGSEFVYAVTDRLRRFRYSDMYGLSRPRNLRG